MAKSAQLDYWQSWVDRNEAAYSDQIDKMDHREALYRGEVREIKPLVSGDKKYGLWLRHATHVRNIIAENIESEVSASIPQPKVTARRQQDERRAKILEDMLRNELDRLPMEELNDQLERTIPIQGGAFWLVEWDNSKRTHSSVGDVVVSVLHPKQVIPQDGVFTRVEDMDAIAIKLPQTRESISRMYGKELPETDGESDPDVRTLDGEADTAEDMVTQYIVYYRNSRGGIGKISWVNDTLLESSDDFEARRLRRCGACGRVETDPEVKACPVCGGALQETVEAAEDVYAETKTQLGTVIPGARFGTSPTGETVFEPTKLPYYKPDVFPVFLQRNVSLFGRLLGDSDVDKIEDQQNTVNRLETKIIDRLIKAGTRITLPDRADLRVDPEDCERWYIGNPADAQSIKLLQFTGDLNYELTYLGQVYEESRQALGITDSFQGRRDTTAQSGVAKQFSAAQSAGRLESKRVLKEAAYAELFKRIVQLKVAYADEPRPIVAEDNRGNAQYEEFNRYDFYEQDAAGEWHCILDDDRFLYSCDTSAPLASNREQMWQDSVQMFQMGAFGNPAELDSLLMLWTKLELLHYPGASDTKEYLEQRKEAQMQMQAQQAAMAEAQQQEALAREQSDREQQILLDLDRQAREDARQMAQSMQQGAFSGNNAARR